VVRHSKTFECLTLTFRESEHARSWRITTATPRSEHLSWSDATPRTLAAGGGSTPGRRDSRATASVVFAPDLGGPAARVVTSRVVAEFFRLAPNGGLAIREQGASRLSRLRTVHFSSSPGTGLRLRTMRLRWQRPFQPMFLPGEGLRNDETAGCGETRLPSANRSSYCYETFPERINRTPGRSRNTT